MDKKIIDRARAEAKLNEGKPSTEFLCKNERVSAFATMVGKQTPESFKWDVYTEDQHGFKTATERIPLYPEERTVIERVDWWRES